MEQYSIRLQQVQGTCMALVGTGYGTRETDSESQRKREKRDSERERSSNVFDAILHAQVLRLVTSCRRRLPGWCDEYCDRRRIARI